MTQDKIIEKVNNINKFIILKFLDNNMVQVKCKKCGSIEIKNINQIIDSRCACKQCYYNRKRDIAKNYLQDKLMEFGNKYTLCEYNGKNKPAKLRCSCCGTIFTALPSNIKRNHANCPNKACNNFKMNIRHTKLGYSTKDIKKEIEEISKNEYHIIENDNKIILLEDKIRIKHDICGRIFTTTRGAFIHRNNRCPYCKKQLQTDKLFNKAQEYLNSISNNRFVLDKGSFISRKSIVEITDTHTGDVFNISYCYFIRKLENKIKTNSTHFASNNEEEIKDYLDSKNIIYYRQKSFSNLVSSKNKKLFFDFYIPKYNLCIEYDGEYHYLDIFGKSILRDQKHNDQLKNKYCKNNNINLLRIPYFKKSHKLEILDMVFNSFDKGNTFSTIKNKLKKFKD